MKARWSACVLSVLAVIPLICRCSSAGRALGRIEKEKMGVNLSMPPSGIRTFRNLDTGRLRKDTIIVDNPDDGRMIVMNAVRDEDTGEMVASDNIQAAVVTARFRNVAERNGMVDLEFQVTVPRTMVRGEWQLRLYPRMNVSGNISFLQPVVITGDAYRKMQLRGYERYRRFLATIIQDSGFMLNDDQLDIFVKRNMPALYALKNDTTRVSDEYVRSLYGVAEEEAVRHYTDKVLERINGRRIASRGKMYDKYVKAPVDSSGIRLDTVLVSTGGDFTYDYVETIRTRPGLRKADIFLCGEILENGKRIYSIPESDSLSFYISSLSSFADRTERYLTRIIERKAHADATFRLSFETGKADLSESFGENAAVMAGIRRMLAELVENRTFDIDSIVVTATASPEGSYAMNRRLSSRRGESVVKALQHYMSSYRDSLDRERGFLMSLDGTAVSPDRPSIGFLTHVLPENWEVLSRLVEQDSCLTRADKDDFRQTALVADPDARSAELERRKFYPYLRDSLYPALRTVRFDFALSRKGMVKDTIHTTVLDSTYMRGVDAIDDHDYQTAVSLLGPYGDYNAAVAYAAMGYNHSALDILEKCEGTDKVNYMLAIIWSRLGEPGKAVSFYLKSCRQNPSFVHRGNLDPEIYLLTREYGLDNITNNITYNE